MATRLLPDVVIPGGQSRFVTLWMDGTDRLLLFFDVLFAAAAAGSGVSANLANGYGSRDPLIPFPYEQPIPLVADDDGLSITSASYAPAVSYPFGTPVVDRQTQEIWVDRKKTGAYIRVELANSEAVVATVTVSADTST